MALVPSSGTARYNGPAGRTLLIRAESDRHNPGHGTPAVLTDEYGEWYSADLVFDPKAGAPIAYAVNGYADEATARIDAESREG